MSRIAGLLSLTLSDLQFDPQLLSNMAARQQHEGFGKPAVTSCGPMSVAVSAAPDDAAAVRHMAHDAARQVWLFIDGTLFNRIELERDLRTAGSPPQPQSSMAEVTMAAYAQWGEACFSRLSGIFAIVILDRAQGKCLLARDQFGAKPLAYSLLGDRLAFASEYAPLLAVLPQRRTNQRALLEFMLHGDVLPPNTLFDGISTIPHGHYLAISREHLQPQLRSYFNAFDVVSQPEQQRLIGIGANGFIDELDTALHQSIAANMADGGPFAVALSGGVDSATLLAIAAQTGDVQAIHVSVPDGPNLDERPTAEAVARHVGTPLSVVTMSGELYRRELVAATHANEMPFWHVQNIGYYLASRRARELGVRALLCGDTIGMMLSPASQLAWQRVYPLMRVASLAPPAATSMVQKLGHALGDLPLNTHGFNWYLPLAVNMIDGYARNTQHRLAEARYQFIGSRLRRRIHGAKLAEVHGFYTRFYYRGDRLGSACGVEYRTPFGCENSLRMAMNLPFEYLVREHTPKWSIKALGSRYIPRAIAFQKKVAWDMPGDMYLGPLATPAFFLDGYCADTFGMSADGIRASLPGWQQEPHRLSRMIHTEIWGRLFIRGESCERLNNWLESFG